MTWEPSTVWWSAAGLLVVAELATGTFYLLMLALGAAAGALAALLGLDATAQLATAAVVGGAAVTAWHLLRARRPNRPSPASNPDLLLDLGGSVRVDAWGSDGRARVQYRGAAWSARFAGPGLPEPGEHVIQAVEGSELLLARRPAHPPSPL